MNNVFIDYIPAGQPNPMANKKDFKDFIPAYVPQYQPVEDVRDVEVKEEPKVEVVKKKRSAK